MKQTAVLVTLALAIGAHAEAPSPGPVAGNLANRDKLKHLISEAAQANNAKIKTLDADIVKTEDTFVSFRGKTYEQKRNIHQRLWNSDAKWRRKLDTSVLDFATGKSVPYNFDAASDGVTSRVLFPKTKLGKVLPGVYPEFFPSKDLEFGYRVFGRDVQKLMDESLDVQISAVPDSKSLQIKATDAEGVIEFEVHVDKNFLVGDARATTKDGKLAGERKGVKFFQQDGGWVVTEASEDVYSYEPDGTRRTISSTSLSTKSVTVNKPVGDEVFKMEFPAGTTVDDMVVGVSYLVGPPGAREGMTLADVSAIGASPTTGPVPSSRPATARDPGTSPARADASSPTAPRAPSSAERAGRSGGMTSAVIVSSVLCLTAFVLVALFSRRGWFRTRRGDSSPGSGE